MEQRPQRKKRKLGAYPFVSVVFSITLAIFVIGLFGLLFIHTHNLSRAIQRNVEIQVYLHKQVSEADIEFLTRTIGVSDFTLKSAEGPVITFISREQAAREFVADNGEDFSEFIGDNPLRDLLVVNVAPTYQSGDSLQKIQSTIQQMNGVYEVNYVKTVVESINDNLTKLGLFLGGFATVLLLVVVILINNTIKLALFSQRFLIRSMQLVGATGTFIRRPFLNRSVWYGIVGGVLSSLFLLGLMFYANSKIENLSELQDTESIGLLFLSLILLGALVGFLSTRRAIRKYLKMSLDELY